MPTRYRHAPVSTRHAFALAFDLVVRRDPLHSLVLPFLIRAPWSLALAVLPSPEESDRPAEILRLSSVALLIDFLLMLIVSAMLRFRARGVFARLPEVGPMPSAAECYSLGIRRLPWLFVTEVARNMAIAFATAFLILPGIFLGFRLSFATEAVVLNEPNTAAAFRRSFRLTEDRFERWLEMIAVSVTLVLGIAFTGAVLWLAFPAPGYATWAALAWLATTAIMPVIQYAWTFFYLRLVEVDHPGQEVGPAYAGIPGPEVPAPGAAS